MHMVALGRDMVAASNSRGPLMKESRTITMEAGQLQQQPQQPQQPPPQQQQACFTMLPLMGDSAGSSSLVRFSRKSGDGGCHGLPNTQHGIAHDGRLRIGKTSRTTQE
jgi:hypothetical protein